MHSPTKNSYPKKTRKNTFSQTAIAQNEVGDFHGGYFVMPDASKENDHLPKSKNTHKVERSPGRRKQHANDSLPSSPIKERSKIELQVCKKAHQQSQPVDIDLKVCLKAESLLTPGSFSLPYSKTNPQVSPKQYFEPSGEQLNKSPLSSPGKDVLSTSPPASGRWAGPAFGNAPHPSTLPLPEWTEFSMSSSPPVHDGGLYLQGMMYSAHPSVYPPSPSPLYSTPSVARSDIPVSSIPVVPFPYVDSVSPALLSTSPSLAQLSTDLRRMLNINGGPIFNSDPILVSANSS